MSAPEITPGLVVREAHTLSDVAAARALIVEYQQSLGVDLEFQHFTLEVEIGRASCRERV